MTHPSEANAQQEQKGIFDISSIVALVKQGKTVVSGEDSMIVDAVISAINERRVATYYVTPAQNEAVMKRYWTHEHVQKSGIKPISDEEIERIKSGLSLDVSGYSNHIECPKCGHGYGMYEFLQQGIEEHGREVVEAILSLRDINIIRVNPIQTPVCPNCRLRIRGGGALLCLRWIRLLYDELGMTYEGCLLGVGFWEQRHAADFELE